MQEDREMYRVRKLTLPMSVIREEEEVEERMRVVEQLTEKEIVDIEGVKCSLTV